MRGTDRLNNSQKTPFALALQAFGDVKTQDWLGRLPQRMPATVTAINGSFLTVKVEGKFDPFTIPTITVPKIDPQWIRTPTQVGDRGYLDVSDYYLGGQSGNAGGNADLFPRANLTNAVFVPISRKSYPTVNPNQLTLTGPQGIVLQDGTSATVVTITATEVLIVCGSGNSVKLKTDGSVTVAPANGQQVYVGGDPDITGSFSPIVTSAGPSPFAQARYA